MKNQFQALRLQKSSRQRAIYPLCVRTKRVVAIGAILCRRSVRGGCPSGSVAFSEAGSVSVESGRVENMGEVVINVQFMLCASTVRRCSVSHPNLCLFGCPSSVRVCLRCRHCALPRTVGKLRVMG